MENLRLLAISCLFISVIFSACKEDELACEAFHWTYEGESNPETWPSCYSDCAGSDQSPIDIVGAVADASLSGLDTDYASSSINLVNNGHSIQQNYDMGSTLTLNGEAFDLLQVHFHTGSEHTVNGIRFPMEAHLVHKSSTSGNLAVVGILFEEGAENTFLAKFIDDVPEEENKNFFSSTLVDISTLLPSDPGYFTYAGSLTTPPCSEIVTWFVMQTAVEASSAQISKIHGIVHDNYRPVQPLNGRDLKSFN